MNGSLADALLGLLDPQVAPRWRDPFIEVPVDLSGVIWLATVNDIGGLPRSLRDRFLVVSFPAPGPEHLACLARRLLRRHARLHDLEILAV